MSQLHRAAPNRLVRKTRTETDGMEVKLYYASSVEEAVDRATYEIGPDAMLIDSRRAPAETRHIGDYEVRFAVPGPGKPAGSGNGGASQASRDLALEIARMRTELTEVRQLIRRKPKPRSEPGFDHVAAFLVNTGFAPDFAREIAAGIERRRRSEAGHGQALKELLDAELCGRIGEVFAGRSDQEPEAVAFIGPPGSGKTTALIKTALRHSAAGKGPAIIVNTDTFRIGSAEQMARYASILGVPLFTADTENGLRQVMETRTARTLVLVDTPGLSGGDIELMHPAGSFLASRDTVERHLVLPATMHWSDLARVHHRYERFRPTHLGFTHLDETDRFGALITSTCHIGLPVGWVSAGQRVPDDLEPATAESLARLAVANPSLASLTDNEERTAS